MKTCPSCLSTTFDNMPICYGCLKPFDIEEAADRQPASSYNAEQAHNERLQARDARFHVTVSDLFGYDIYLHMIEGAELTIGCARDNNIVLPHTESRRHLLRIYYSQGEIWVQDKGSSQKAQIENTPLTGTRCLRQGVVLQVGEARIELIAA